MLLPRSTHFGIAVTLALALAAPGVAVPAAADDSFEFAPIHAPFECGSEWSGGTRPGHGHNDWNLDLNRTSRTFSEPQHDLGQPLIAQADGTIVWIGQHVSAGTYVEIDYGEITARYVHLVDDSVPAELEVGSPVAEGQLFGLLGDTGNATHAHLHLEYFDSRDYDDARAWLLPATNQIRIRMAGEIIDPHEAFVSTNCGGSPQSSPTTTTTTTVPYPFADVDEDSFAYDDIALLHGLAITEGTAETTFSPDVAVDREQMAAFLARLYRLVSPDTPAPEGDYPFDDVDPSSFAYDDIQLIHALGITTGTSASTYSPGEVVDREQMAAFLNRVHELVDPVTAASPPTTTPDPLSPPPLYPFADVDEASFAYADIARIHQLGITTGTSASTYSPAAAVDREQMAAFLARVYRLLATTE